MNCDICKQDDGEPEVDKIVFRNEQSRGDPLSRRLDPPTIRIVGSVCQHCVREALRRAGIKTTLG